MTPPDFITLRELHALPDHRVVDLFRPVSAVNRFINAIIGGREFASREKHTAPVDAGARGPFTITAVFLTAPGSHPSRKRPQRQQKPASEPVFCPGSGISMGVFFRRLLTCPPHDRIHKPQPKPACEGRGSRGSGGYGVPGAFHRTSGVSYNTPGFTLREQPAHKITAQ